MDNLKKILQKISKIVIEEETIQEEQRKRGELFNVFSILGLQTDEVRLHSAFLAELLNPNGTHGLGNKFLDAFLDVLDDPKDSFAFDSKSAYVEVERYIGNISKDGEEGGRIDLLIQDKNNQTIIIENKIYAVDQYRQLSRYYRYSKEILKLKESQRIILYLTLDGNSPSEESLGKDDFNYVCISYRKEILKWLDKCLALSALYPFVRETIRQYIITLKNILSIMENNGKVVETILATESNLKAALVVRDCACDITQEIIKRFINKLKELAKVEGMNFEANPYFCELQGGKNKKAYSRISFWIENYPFAKFSLEQNWSKVYYGIVAEKNTQGIFLEKLYDNSPTDGWPYGHSDFGNSLKDWNTADALLDLTKEKGTIYTTIEKKLKEAKDRLKALNEKIVEKESKIKKEADSIIKPELISFLKREDFEQRLKLEEFSFSIDNLEIRVSNVSWKKCHIIVSLEKEKIFGGLRHKDTKDPLSPNELDLLKNRLADWEGSDENDPRWTFFGAKGYFDKEYLNNCSNWSLETWQAFEKGIEKLIQDIYEKCKGIEL